MTFRVALMRTLRPSVVALVVFVAVSLGSDAYFDRPTDVNQVAFGAIAFFVLFWAMLAYRMRVRNR